MKAAVFVSKGVLEIRDVPKPSPKPDEILLRVKACGVCATDVHALYGGESISGRDPFPLIPGHEFTGVVEEVGKDVINVRVGDKVAVDPIYNCGQCYFCQTNQENHCEHLEGPGTTVPGGFAEYVAVPAYAALKFEKLDFDEAALMEPLATVIYGQERARIQYADNVLIIGAGAIGLLHLQLAKASGTARVVVVDLDKAKLDRAKALGADAVFQQRIEPSSPDAAKLGIASRQRDAILDFSPMGYDVVIEATGVPGVVEAGVRYLKKRGRLLVFGVAPHHSEIRLNPYDIYRNDWEIIGAFALNRTAVQSLSLLEAGIIKAKPVIGKQYKLEELGEALQALAQGRADGKLQILF
ncbi:MAG: zinc-dependent alcohol dehydrogenase family protein [Firmicutes bacterium]|nr:zinc-dependent alcohol dehydrogenase family protein [Bacillota bacterium]